MSVIQLNVKLTPQDLRQALAQLDTPELDNLVSELLLIKAQRHAPLLPKEQSALLQKINQGLPSTQQDRFAYLTSRRQAGSLTGDEHDELIRLNQKLEARTIERLQYLVELAQLRQIPLPELLDELGLDKPNYV